MVSPPQAPYHMAPTKQPWERLPDEKARAYAAFRTFIDLGYDRSYSQVAERTGNTIKTVSCWGSSYNWAARAEAWDDHEVERRSLLLQREKDEMLKRHAAIAFLFQSKVIERLSSFSDEDLKALTASELISWYKISSSEERKARGLPDHLIAAKVAHSGPDGEGPIQVHVVETIVRSREDVIEAKKLADRPLLE